MHVLVADRLTCSRCGPEFGLILRADKTHDRRVTEGVLGCPNCRDQYPITDGFGDLRAPPRPELPKGRAGDPVIRTQEESEYLLPLLGIIRGPATVLLIGGPTVLGPGLAALLDDIHVVGVDADLASMFRESIWRRALRRMISSFSEAGYLTCSSATLAPLMACPDAGLINYAPAILSSTVRLAMTESLRMAALG